MNEKEMKLREEIAALGLTDKQKAFCEAYLEHFDGPKAVKATGYGGKNAGKMFSQLMASESVQAYISLLKREISSRINLRLEDVMREYMRIGFARITDYAEFDQHRIKLKKSRALTPDQIAAVASVEHTREGVKIKMHSKMDALAKLKEFCEEPPDKKPPGDKPSIHIGEIRIALGSPDMRKALDQVSRAFLGKKMKNLDYLDEHIAKVTNAITAPKSDSGEDN